MVWVMGLEDAKSGRMPTEAETAEMKRIVHEAMDHGACGWSAQRFGQNSVQADYDGTPMVTDLMHDETAIELAKVLGERNEGFIQMSYIPDASKYEGDMQTHSEKHYEELALTCGPADSLQCNRSQRYVSGALQAPARMAGKLRQARHPRTRAERDARTQFRVHLQGLEPVGRYAGVA